MKLAATEAVPFKIDFICAAPDFFVTWDVVCRSIFCERSCRLILKLQNRISLSFLAHKRVLSFRR